MVGKNIGIKDRQIVEYLILYKYKYIRNIEISNIDLLLFQIVVIWLKNNHAELYIIYLFLILWNVTKQYFIKSVFINFYLLKSSPIFFFK